MMDSAAMDWLRELTGAQSSREVGARLGRSHATILRWARTGIPPRVVLSLVAKYDCDLFDTLQRLGWLSSEERDKIAPTIDQLPTRELTAELYRLSGVVHDRISEIENREDGHARKP